MAFGAPNPGFATASPVAPTRSAGGGMTSPAPIANGQEGWQQPAPFQPSGYATVPYAAQYNPTAMLNAGMALPQQTPQGWVNPAPATPQPQTGGALPIPTQLQQLGTQAAIRQATPQPYRMPVGMPFTPTNLAQLYAQHMQQLQQNNSLGRAYQPADVSAILRGRNTQIATSPLARTIG